MSRTSKQAWLEEVEGINVTEHGYYGQREDVLTNDNMAMKISDRISLATRLYTASQSGGEPYQVKGTFKS